MTITAKVIAHSRAPGSPDLITLECRYPRFIHAEFMTHRVFSRNASSSRAIPIKRMIQDVIDDPAMPVAWGSNKPGMQAGEECRNPVELYHHQTGPDDPRDDDFHDFTAAEAWCKARDHAVRVAQGFAEAGYHKQIVNRLLEPFGHISVVVTATEWQNFFDLRCHPDADPTMRALAEAMRDAISESSSIQPIGNWHLPYITESDIGQITKLLEDPEHGADHLDFLPNISVARCARVSYLNHDGSDPDIEKDLALAKRLFECKHMSPFEHQARVAERCQDEGLWMYEHLQGNFVGWNQHRKMLEVR